MVEFEPVTVQQAQFLVGIPAEEINRAIDRGLVEKHVVLVTEPAPAKRVKVRRTPRGRRSRSASSSKTYGLVLPKTVTRKVRTLGRSELLYFALGREVHESFTPEARKKLYEAIKALPEGANKVSIGPVDIALKPAIARVNARVRALRDARTGIVEPARKEPVFKGTEIPVHLIAALAEGQGVDETLADYPSLTRKQVLRAVDYARAYPKKGRPYPGRSLKRSLSALAQAGVFDTSADAEPLGPDHFK